jgi:predicted  nucleic acid-binding Zn-ribbon protein
VSLKTLKNRLEQDKDKHQAEIVAIQESYKDKLKQQTSEYEEEINALKSKLSQLEAELDQVKVEKENYKLMSSSTVTTSNKSDDGWCLNGDIKYSKKLKFNKN